MVDLGSGDVEKELHEIRMTSARKKL
jgi:hypothetical protein